MSIETNSNIPNPGIPQFVPATTDEAYQTTNVSSTTSAVVQDKIEDAALGRGVEGASVTVVNNKPTLPAPADLAMPEMTGNNWLDAGNMMAFILIMSEVLKEKMKDSAQEGKMAVATMVSIQETGKDKAETQLAKGILEAVKFAISAIVEFGGAAMAGAAVAQRVNLTKQRTDFEAKQTGPDGNPTYGMSDAQKSAYGNNQTEITHLTGLKETNPSTFTPEQQTRLTDLQGKQAGMQSKVREEHNTRINQDIAQIDAQLQINQQITRGLDSLNQAAFTLMIAIKEKEITLIDMAQSMNQTALQSNKETHGKIEEDISAAINLLQEAVRKNMETFNYGRAA
jgi:hypothetical protein